MVKTLDLTYAYDDGHEFKFPNINLHAGEHLLIIGPSGVGKTTLLYLMAGLLTPLQGSVSINETKLTSLSRQELERVRY